MEPLSEPSEPVRSRPEHAPTRPGIVVIAALLTELAVIGAVANQWVAVRVAKSLASERDHLSADFKASLLTFNWRLAPQAGDTTHTWLGQVLLIMATLFLTTVFVSVIVRGPAAFGRVFITCWVSVIAAVMLATIVRGAVNENTLGGDDGWVQRALFGSNGPNSISFFAAVALGLVVATVAASVTVMHRNRVELGPKRIPPAEPPKQPAAAPEQPPPFYPEPEAAEAEPTAPAPRAANETAAPRAANETAAPRRRPTPAGAPAGQFPRPPDDEPLGQLPE